MFSIVQLINELLKSSNNAKSIILVSFQKKLASARRICVVGNGGISLELVYEVADCEIVWAIRHDAIGNTFFDAGAAQFLAPRLFEKEERKKTTPEAENDAEALRKKLKKRPQFESETVNGVAVFTKKPRDGGGLDAVEEAVKRAQKRGRDDEEEEDDEEGVVGSALGPDWKETLTMKGALGRKGESSSEINTSDKINEADKSNVLIEYKVEVNEILTAEQLQYRSDLPQPNAFPSSSSTTSSHPWNVFVVLSNGNVWGVDLVVSATGVEPTALPIFSDDLSENATTLSKDQKDVDSSNPPSKSGVSLAISAKDGGILVDAHMRTSLPGIFAAGDAATANWTPAPNWFQMRLWSQARQMGGAAAKAMVAEVEGQAEYLAPDFCFECFAHVTKFFDYKCVLIGRFNGQGLEEDDDYHVILRTTPGVEYIKLVVANNRIQGAVMIGETDLEETFENLILNQFDISQFGESILDPEVDIEDYFD